MPASRPPTPPRARLFLIVTVIGVLGLAGVQLGRVVGTGPDARAWAPAAWPAGVALRAARSVPAAPRIELDLALARGTTIRVQISPRGTGPPPYLSTPAHQIGYTSASGHQEATPPELGQALDALGAHLRRLEVAGQRLGGSPTCDSTPGLAWLALALAGLGITGMLHATARALRPRSPRRRRWILVAALAGPLLVGAGLRWTAAPPGLSEDERTQLREALGVGGASRVVNEGLPQPAQSALLGLLAGISDSRASLQAGVLLVSLLGLLAAGLLAAPPAPLYSPGRLPAPEPPGVRLAPSLGSAVLLAGLVVALSPVLVHLATNLRGYTLGAAAATLSVLALASAPRRPVAGPLLFLVLAGIAGLAHPVALAPPGAAFLIMAWRERAADPAGRWRTLAGLLGLAVLGLLLLPDLVLALAYHAGDPDPEFTASRLKSLCQRSLGLPWWLLVASAVVAATRLRGPSALPAAALLAGLLAPLVLAPWGRIEGRHLAFAVPFLAALAGRAASCTLSRRRLTPGLLLGILLLAGVGGYWQALPGALDHGTRALGRLGRQLRGSGPVLVIPEPAATPVLDARLDLTPRELARVEWVEYRPAVGGAQQAGFPGAAQPLAPPLLRAPRSALGSALAASRGTAGGIRVVLPDSHGTAEAPDPGCRSVAREGDYHLWHCPGGP